jgi:6-phosphogluconate dehydrogenase (decarboxylating)
MSAGSSALSRKTGHKIFDRYREHGLEAQDPGTAGQTAGRRYGDGKRVGGDGFIDPHVDHLCRCLTVTQQRFDGL